MTFPEKNDFYLKEWLLLKRMTSTEKKDFCWKEWLLLQRMTFTEKNDFDWKEHCLPNSLCKLRSNLEKTFVNSVS